MYNFIFYIQKLRPFLIFVFFIIEVQAAMMPHHFGENKMHKDLCYDIAGLTKNSSMKMLISPTNPNLILMAKSNGVISSLLLGDKPTEEILIEHNSLVKHIPLFKAAAAQDNSLWIVSAGNYIENNQPKSECCIFNNRLNKKIVWCSQLQAIAINTAANLLAIADQMHTVSLIDLSSGNKVGSKWTFAPNKSDHILDVAFTEDGKKIIGVRANGITVMEWNGRILDSTIPIILYSDLIKRIYCPNDEQLIYTTRDKKIKMLNINEIVNAPNNLMPITLVEALLKKKITIDEKNCAFTALWKKHKQIGGKNSHQIIEEKNPHQIIVKSIVPGNNNKYRLDVSIADNYIYDYRSKQGSLKQGKVHLVQVAMSDGTVAAIDSSGQLHYWRVIIAEDEKDDKIVNNNNTSQSNAQNQNIEAQGNSQPQGTEAPVSREGKRRSNKFKLIFGHPEYQQDSGSPTTKVKKRVTGGTTPRSPYMSDDEKPSSRCSSPQRPSSPRHKEEKHKEEDKDDGK